nr:MFS transporter [Candidatus Sigynarchaeota archaeon]
QEKGIPIMFFGIFFVICDGMSALGSIISHRVVKRIGSKTILIAGCMIATILTLLSTIVPNWVLVGILNTVPSIFWGINQPVWDLYINKEIESDKRASIMSASNLVNYLGFTVFMPLCGLLVDQFSVVAVIQVLSLLGIVSLGGIFKLNEVKSELAR